MEWQWIHCSHTILTAVAVDCMNTTAPRARCLATLKPVSSPSGAGMGEDGNRGNNENYRNDYPAVAINLLRV
jgi:hypothetical protein